MCYRSRTAIASQLSNQQLLIRSFKKQNSRCDGVGAAMILNWSTPKLWSWLKLPGWMSLAPVFLLQKLTFHILEHFNPFLEPPLSLSPSLLPLKQPLCLQVHTFLSPTALSSAWRSHHLPLGVRTTHLGELMASALPSSCLITSTATLLFLLLLPSQ